MTYDIREYEKKEKVKSDTEYRVLITNDEGAILDGGTYKTIEDAEEAIALLEGGGKK